MGRKIVSLHCPVYARIKRLALERQLETNRQCTISDIVELAIAAQFPEIDTNGQKVVCQGNSK